MEEQTLPLIPEPQAIAPLVVYLLAEESCYVTGAAFYD